MQGLYPLSDTDQFMTASALYLRAFSTASNIRVNYGAAMFNHILSLNWYSDPYVKQHVLSQGVRKLNLPRTSSISVDVGTDGKK